MNEEAFIDTKEEKYTKSLENYRTMAEGWG